MKAIRYRGRMAMRPDQFTLFHPFQPEKYHPNPSFSSGRMAMHPTINGRTIEPDKYAFVLKSTRARVPCKCQGFESKHSTIMTD